MTDVSTHKGHLASDNSDLREKAVTAKDAVVDLASEAKHYASQRVSAVKDKAVDMMDSAKEKAVDIGDQVAGYVKKNPYKSIAIAAGAGLLIGILLKRRR